MITSFSGEYDWLSNFSPVFIIYEDKRYPSVEHAYQAAKSVDKEWRKFCKNEKRPSNVKKASRHIKVRADWGAVKISIMKELLQQKFADDIYSELLLETRDIYLIEGNTWGDRFWGVDIETGEGRNVLGHLLMEIRQDLHKINKQSNN